MPFWIDNDNHPPFAIVTLIIDGETIKTTLEHPFRTMGDDWVAAGNLQIGDALRNAGGDAGTVTAIHFAIAPQPMYNLTVAIAHTYSVGNGQWLVHNECAKLQTGGHTFKNSTARALNESLELDFSARTYGDALENLKISYGIRGNVHGQIRIDGSYWISVNGEWQMIDYIQYYFP